MVSNESLKDLINLLKHITYKKYKKNYSTFKISQEELIRPYEDKVVRLNTFKKANDYISSLR
ncbi:MAG TPA: hypothetical protein QGH03_01085 [Candidatus Paceibacterota bacterium]|jgi:hypothetical protein|nr:hypothetical protein [Candidatus Paceibacterota bacterium]